MIDDSEMTEKKGKAKKIILWTGLAIIGLPVLLIVAIVLSINPVKPTYPPVREWTAAWGERNGCAAGPTESTAPPDVSRIEYPRCAEGAAVILYVIHGGGHTWPGGKPMPEWHVGPTNNSIDATSKMWAFFLEHSSDE